MEEIADAMLSGKLCEACGGALASMDKADECDCNEGGVPMYCSRECANDAGASKEMVCPHQ